MVESQIFTATPAVLGHCLNIKSFHINCTNAVVGEPYCCGQDRWWWWYLWWWWWHSYQDMAWTLSLRTRKVMVMLSMMRMAILKPYRWGQGRWPAEREKHWAELPVAPTAGTRIVNCHYSSSLMICDLYRRRTKNSEIPQRRVLTIWLNVSTMIRWYGNGERFGEISSRSKKLLP